MQGKNGFTLVELLAVIVILALVMAIAIPVVLDVRSNVTGTLSQEQKKGLQDAGKLLGIDLDDYSSDIFNCKDGSWIKSSAECTMNSSNWKTVKIDVSTLVDHGYFKDDAHHCTGSITIDKTDSGYRVTNNDVKC